MITNVIDRVITKIRFWHNEGSYNLIHNYIKIVLTTRRKILLCCLILCQITSFLNDLFCSVTHMKTFNPMNKGYNI